MSHRQSVHDLESLVRSFHSLIAIETVEEERVRAIVSEVAADLQQPLFEWSVNTGFRRGRGLAIGNTHDALAVLKHIDDMPGDAIYLLKDLAPHLTKAETARALRELIDKMAHTRSAIIITGDPIDLPRDLDALAVRFELRLPDEAERRSAVRHVVEAMKARQPVYVDRGATQVAEAMAPVVLWIDELEKAFASGTAADADGGLSQRLFASFLTWLQEKKEGVFIVGAANDLDRTPPELLRKGRFDEIFFVDLPTHDERLSIFAIHLRMRKQDPATFDLDALASTSEGFSGSEIEQSVIAALYRALHAKEKLTSEGVIAALRSTVPLSVARREDIARIRSFAQGRFSPVS